MAGPQKQGIRGEENQKHAKCREARGTGCFVHFQNNLNGTNASTSEELNICCTLYWPTSCKNIDMGVQLTEMQWYRRPTL